MGLFGRLFGRGVDYSTAKSHFLKNNGSFSEGIVEKLFTQLDGANPWLLHSENATAQTLRTIFIGSNDLYIFVGMPYSGFGEDRHPWPQTFNVMNGGRDVIYYTYLKISYANDLGHEPISNYSCSVSNMMIPRERVLSWVAEDICDNFKRKYPLFTTSNTTLTQSKDYYYFTYNVVKPQLTGW